MWTAEADPDVGVSLVTVTMSSFLSFVAVFVSPVPFVR